jgi:hypothetical protein
MVAGAATPGDDPSRLLAEMRERLDLLEQSLAVPATTKRRKTHP